MGACFDPFFCRRCPSSRPCAGSSVAPLQPRRHARKPALGWARRRRRSLATQTETLAQRSHRVVEPALIEPKTVQAVAAAAPRERSPNPTWCDEEADRHGTQVEHPGREVIPTPAGELPRTDLRLSHRGRGIARGNVMEIVEPDRSHTSPGVRERQQNRAELQPHPASAVASVLTEAVFTKVLGSSVPEWCGVAVRHDLVSRPRRCFTTGRRFVLSRHPSPARPRSDTDSPRCFATV